MSRIVATMLFCLAVMFMQPAVHGVLTWLYSS